MFEASVSVAERHGLGAELLIGRSNLGDLLFKWDQPGSAASLEAAIADARRLGDRGGESLAAGNLMGVHLFAGRWAEAASLGSELLGDDGLATRPDAEYLHQRMAVLHTLRGELPQARAAVEGIAPWATTDDLEARSLFLGTAALVMAAEGDLDGASRRAREAIDLALENNDFSGEATRMLWPDAIGGALTRGDAAEARALLALLADQPRGRLAPYLRAELRRARGRIAAAEGDDADGERHLRAAVEELRALGYPYFRARAETDLAAWLVAQRREADAATVLEEALATFDRLGAAPAAAAARRIVAPAPERVGA